MISDYYNKTVILLANTQTVNAIGEPISALSSSVDIKCAIQGRSGSQSVVNEADRLKTNYRMYCSSTHTINIDDQIKDGSVYYDVIWVNNNLRSNHQQVDLEISRAYKN